MMPTIGTMWRRRKDPRKNVPSNRLVLPTTKVGVEIEIENVVKSIEIDKSLPARYWNREEDHSLRNNGAEFTSLEGGLFGEDLINSLELLDELKYWGCEFSERCGLHFHLDVNDLRPHQVLDLLYIYVVLEDYIFYKFADTRRHNIFCLPINTISPPTNLSRTTLKGSFLYGISEYNKYTALNLKPVECYGTVEFRMGVGTFNKGLIINFINHLMRLKKWVMEGGNVKDLEVYSGRSGVDIIKEVVGSCQDGYTEERANGALISSLRWIQEIENLSISSIHPISGRGLDKLKAYLKKEAADITAVVMDELLIDPAAAPPVQQQQQPNSQSEITEDNTMQPVQSIQLEDFI